MRPEDNPKTELDRRTSYLGSTMARSQATANCFLIGAQKCGTTAVYNWLGQHPDIYAPFHVKDLAFFTSSIYENGHAFYRSLFDRHKGQKAVAACDVNAIFHSGAAERIRAFSPEARLILIVRNPVSRAISSYRYAVQRGLELEDFATAVDEEVEGKRKYNPYLRGQLSYVDHGFYFRQLKRFLEHFERRNIFVGVFDDLKGDNTSFMQKVCHFLEIADDFAFTLSSANPTRGGYRFKFVNDILFPRSGYEKHAPYKAFDILPITWRYKLRRYLFLKINNFNKKTRPLPPIGHSVKQRLADVYRDDVSALSDYLGRDLVRLWLERA
jgi:hypothetical protein